MRGGVAAAYPSRRAVLCGNLEQRRCERGRGVSLLPQPRVVLARRLQRHVQVASRRHGIREWRRRGDADCGTIVSTQQRKLRYPTNAGTHAA